VLGAWGAPQRKKGKGKATAGSSGAGGGPSTKAAAAAGSSGQGSSSQGSSHPSAPPARIIGLSTEEPAVQVAEPATSAQQTEPQPAGGGNTKQDKDRQRKERQRQRKIEVASKSLQWAMEAMAEHGLRCVRSHEAPSKLRPAHRSFVLTEAKAALEQARVTTTVLEGIQGNR
jgi:hypothetical protein